MIKEINKLKTELKLKGEEIIVKKRENELKNKLNEEEIDDKYNNKIDYNQIQSSINNVYNNIISKVNNNNNISTNVSSHISNFIISNSNDIAKLNEINKQINILFNNQKIYSLLYIENEKLKKHIKEIINITLENTSIMYIKKFNEDYNDINIEQLMLKIIDYIKVIKICFLLQKIKSTIHYGEKYLNWLSDKEYFKNNSISIKEFKNEIDNINNEIDNIKNTIKNNSLNLEKKFKNFLGKDEVRIELNNIQKKYEKIISDIFEYFLKYKIINEKNNEYLILQIPIKSYNLMIENNMNNISLIGQSIESWNLYVNNELDYNNNNIFQEIINLTNINNLIEYNNISEIINNNNESTINNNININDFIENNKNIEDNNNSDSYKSNDNDNYNENDNENDNDNDNNNDNDNYNDNKNQTQSSHPKESKSQYSFDKQ